MIDERVLQLRRDRGLLGILTPAAPSRAIDMACVLMNAGVTHRIGPHRLNVKLARHLADLGVTTIRLDLSGLGDSRPEGSARSFSDQAIADVRTAMDQVQRLIGTRRFIVSGLCSGAAVSFRTALVDPRIVGLQLLDPYAYPTHRTTLRYYLGRMLLMEGWAGALANILRPQQVYEEANGMLSDFVKDPPPEEFARGLAILVERGVSVMCLYTGSLLKAFNYDSQFDETMAPYGIGGRIRVEHMPRSTHTFIDIASQRRLMEITDDWLQSISNQGRERLEARPSRASMSLMT